MAIDFSVEPEFQKQIDWVERFVKEEIEPLDQFMGVGTNEQGERLNANEWQAIRHYIKDLQQQIKDQGLWGFHLGPELGGPGLGQVKLSLLNEKLGRTRMGPYLFGCQAPDTGNMELIAHNGTEAQKEKYLKPLLDGDMHSAYSMTEPHSGSPDDFKCMAVQDGDEWVLNGEKWFTSNGASADFLIVMAITAPEKPMTERATMFIVDRNNPGVEIIRNVHTIGKPIAENYKTTGHGHAYIRYNNVRVSADAVLGEVGAGFLGSQKRLSGGRVHHAMRAVGVCTKALDMCCERVLSRESKGEKLSEFQSVQHDLSDSYIQLKQFRLHVLYVAWMIDQAEEYTQDIRQEISAIKISAAKVNHDIIYRAIHLHGALGMSNELPLGDMWMSAPQMGIMDGVTEVHKSNLAKLMLRGYEPCDDLFPSYHIPKLITAAQRKFAKVVAAHVENA